MTPVAGGGAPTLALLDQVIDLAKGGKPDVLLMSKRTRRKLKSLLTASAHYVESGETSFGRQVMLYDGIPVLTSDFILDTEAADNGSGSTFSSIYAVHFSPADGMVGLTNGGIDVIDVGQLETKDAGDEGREPGAGALVRGPGDAAGLGGGERGHDRYQRTGEERRQRDRGAAGDAGGRDRGAGLPLGGGRVVQGADDERERGGDQPGGGRLVVRGASAVRPRTTVRACCHDVWLDT
jgi:hypothetical protein